MIVISGALVLVALVLLLIGLFQPELGFVYASIAVSLVSFGFLIVGVLQRRREQPTAGAEPSTSAGAPAGAGASASKAGSTSAGSSLAAGGALPAVDLDEGITALIPAPAATGTASADATAPSAVGGRVSGSVLVVEGRPRYHVAGCRYLTGKTVDEIDVSDAHDEGFTACGVCKPDLALESAPAPEPSAAPTRRVPRVPAAATNDSAEAAATDLPSGESVEDAEPADTKAPAGGLEQTALEVPIVEQPEDERPEVMEPAKAAALTSQATATAAPGRTPAKAVPAVKPGKAAKAVPAKKAAKAAKGSPAPAAEVVPTTLLEPPAAAAVAPAKKTAAPGARAAKSLPVTAPVPTVPVKAATKASKATTQGLAKSPAKTQAPAKAVTKAAKAPASAKAPAKTAAAASIPASKTGKGSVVVIPDRGRFHTADCRYVRRADDAQTLTRAQALRQGYEACGVCTP